MSFFSSCLLNFLFPSHLSESFEILDLNLLLVSWTIIIVSSQSRTSNSHLTKAALFECVWVRVKLNEILRVALELGGTVAIRHCIVEIYHFAQIIHSHVTASSTVIGEIAELSRRNFRLQVTMVALKMLLNCCARLWHHVTNISEILLLHIVGRAIRPVNLEDLEELTAAQSLMGREEREEGTWRRCASNDAMKWLIICANARTAIPLAGKFTAIFGFLNFVRCLCGEENEAKGDETSCETFSSKRLKYITVILICKDSLRKIIIWRKLSPCTLSFTASLDIALRWKWMRIWNSVATRYARGNTCNSVETSTSLACWNIMKLLSSLITLFTSQLNL